jgi:hypothetical protein
MLHGFQEEPTTPSFDWLSFAKRHADSPHSSLALPAQWLISKLENKPFMKGPQNEKSDWGVCDPAGDGAFRMIRVSDGEFKLRLPASNNKPERDLFVVVDRPYWLSQCEVTQALVEKFFESNPEQRDNWKIASSPELPAGLLPLDVWLKLCNWLSDKEGLEPCFYFEDSAGCRPTSLKGVWYKDSANGYRPPKLSEVQLAAVQGDVERYFEYSELYPYSKEVCPTQEIDYRKATCFILPDAWSFQGIMGGDLEIVIDSKNEICVTLMKIDNTRMDSLALLNSTIASRTPDQTNLANIRIRLARNAEN